jgi:hypothetical protein
MMKFKPQTIVSLVLFTASSLSAAQPAAGHGHVPRTQSGLVFERFSRIHVPAAAAAVSRALGDSTWINQAAIHHVTFIAGWIPIEHDLSPPGGVFAVDLNAPKSLHNAGYVMYIHTAADFPEARGKGDADGVIALRRFFAGNAPRNVKIDEYSLCYPNGRVLHVLPHLRKMIGPLF